VPTPQENVKARKKSTEDQKNRLYRGI